jgi:hypothetical protein
LKDETASPFSEGELRGILYITSFEKEDKKREALRLPSV